MAEVSCDDTTVNRKISTYPWHVCLNNIITNNYLLLIENSGNSTSTQSVMEGSHKTSKPGI